jgi:ketosteroid isomerase-like protein
MKHHAFRGQLLARVLRTSLKLGLASAALFGAGCSDSMGDPPFAHDPPAAYVPVAAYIAALNAHSFAHAADFARADWNFINPKGVWSRGRDASVATLNKLEAGVLKGVTFSTKRASIVYASSDVALVTITTLAAHTPADEALERSTFVVVKEDDKWALLENQVTTVSDDAVVGDQGTEYEGPVPSDVGGEPESQDLREEKARASMDWFNGLPVTHDFDSAADFTTPDWNLVTPTGYWARDREHTLSSVRNAFSTFLDGTTYKEHELVVHFPTDDVAVQFEAGTVTRADEQGLQVATFVVVNHQGHWLLVDSHISAVP